MRPGNYEIFRDSATAHGLFATNDSHESPEGRAGNPLPAAGAEEKAGAHGLSRHSRATPEVPHPSNKDFAWASGRFQLECYKEEIEANLRTSGLEGFQLLDLHDYVGQGTALVGLLDTFWQNKGYVTPAEFREFCSPVVPLARLTNRVFTTADKFEVPVEVANYGESPLTNAVGDWQIVDSAGKTVAHGGWPATTIPLGKNFALGQVTADLSSLPTPGQYTLAIEVGDDVRSLQSSESVDDNLKGKLEPPHVGSYKSFTNDWNFWLYPARISDAVPLGVLVTRSWEAAEKELTDGGKVLFMPRTSDLHWNCPPLDRVPIFWNRLMNPGWSRMLGLWCETNHPALAEFPTQANCDWQWTTLLHNTRAVNLDHLPRSLQPIVQAIDDWNRNWKLGLIFEAKVGQGKLVLCSIDLNSETNPVARQLRRSLLDYMAGVKFQPQTEISPADFRGLHFNSLIMRELGATAHAEGKDAQAVIDGYPNTYCLLGESRRGTRPIPFPHELTIAFPKPVAMNGIELMPRQNDRNHFGDTRDFKIEASDDGERWREVAHGELLFNLEPAIN